MSAADVFLPINQRIGGGALLHVQHPAKDRKGEPKRSVVCAARWGVFGEPIGVHQGEPDVRNRGTILIPLPGGGNDQARTWVVNVRRCMMVSDVYAGFRQCVHIGGLYTGAVPVYADRAELRLMHFAEQVARAANRAALGISATHGVDDFERLVLNLRQIIWTVVPALERIRDDDKIAGRDMLHGAATGRDRLGRVNESATMARTVGAAGRFARRGATISRIQPRIVRRQQVVGSMIRHAELAFLMLGDFLDLVFEHNDGAIIERLTPVGRKRTALRIGMCRESIAAVDFLPQRNAAYRTLQDLYQVQRLLEDGADPRQVRFLLRRCRAAISLQNVQRSLERSIYRLTFSDRDGLPQSQDDAMLASFRSMEGLLRMLLERDAEFENPVAERALEHLCDAQLISLEHFPWSLEQARRVRTLLQHASALI